MIPHPAGAARGGAPVDERSRRERPAPARRPPSAAGDTQEWSRGEVLALVVVTLGLAVAAAWTVGRQSLTGDEAASWAISGHTLGDLLHVLGSSGGDRAAGLYYVVLWWWTRVFGTGVTALRSLSVVAAVATLPAFHVVARRFGRPSAFAADLLLAASPFFLTYARQARAYSLAILLVVLTVGAFLRALDTGAARHWTTFVVLAGLALYTQWFAALVLVALYGAAVATARTAVVTRRATAATVTLVVLAAPILVLIVLGDTGGVDWIAPLSWAQFQDLAATLASTHATVGQVACFGVAAVGLVAALARCRASHVVGSSAAVAVAATWFVVPTALLVAVSVAKPLLVPRYLAVTVPGLALLLALGLGEIVRHRSLLMVAAVGLLSVLGSAGYRPLWAARSADEDWSGIVETVAHQTATDQAVFVFPASAEYAVGYYARSTAPLDRRVGPTWPPVPWADPYGHAAPSAASALHTAQSVRASVVWLVLRRPVGPTIRATTSNPATLQALERVLARRFPHHVTVRPFHDHTATLVRYSIAP